MHPKQPNIRLLLLFAALTVIGLFFSILYLRPSSTPDSPQSSSPTPNQTDDVLNQAEQFLARGDELHKEFQHANAIKYFNEALRLYQEANNQAKEAITLGRIGSVYHDLSSYNKAIEFHKKRLVIARNIGDKREEFAALSSLGNAYDLMGNYAQALDYHTQSSEIAQKINYLQGQAIAQGELGNVYHKLGDYKTALKKHNDRLRIAVGLEDRKLSLKLAGNAFSGLGNAYYAREEYGKKKKREDCNEKKEDYNEAIKYHTLHLKLAQEISDRQGEAIAWGSLGSVYNHLWKQSTQNSVDDWRDLVIAWDRSGDNPNNATIFDDLEQKKILQAYYNLLIKPIDDLLPTKEDEKVIFVPQGPLFLLPFAALQNPSDQKYLIQKHTILTAPSIQTIQILSQRRTQQQNIKPNRKSEDILIVGIKKSIIGFKQSSRQFCSKSYSLKELPKAAEEATEIAHILGLSPAKVLIDDKATEAAVKQQMPQARIIHLATHGLLDSCEEEAIPGAIALAEDSETDKANDSWLTASEIFDMKDKENTRLDKAELVVLSACDTGGGRLTGDGVIGLSRSLIAAGTPSVVVSLRRVNDKSTKVLMTRFYHYWYKNKLDKAQALRLAMLDTMKTIDTDKETKTSYEDPSYKETKTSYEDPSYWAAFTLIGLP